MGKISNAFLLLIILITSVTLAQESNIKDGLIKTHLTLSPSSMLNKNGSYFYLHGGLSYYVSPKISVDGEGYYLLGAFSDEKVFKYNHNLFFGASKHFTKKNNDLYVGIQPGVSITKLSETANNFKTTKTGINPVASIVVGYNYYVNKYFHFFIQSRLIGGEHLYDINKNLNEFRFSAGLGLNLNTKKKE